MSLPPPIPPFRALGYLAGIYYYYSRGEQCVVDLSASGHGKKNLYRLAPHEYWVAKHPATKKGDFDENSAASALMDACQLGGIFSIKNIRGRGVWMEKNKPVIHFGDRVVIDGKEYKPQHTPGKMIYELGEALGYNICDPLTDEQGKSLQLSLSKLRWQTPEHHLWFTGWQVCAIMGGALPWRPHIWLTGAAQTGKSTLSRIMRKLLGDNCLYIKSVSTEAGIRQTLKADCLAVVMDEAEREDDRSHNRLQSILTLARQASSDDDAKIVKGTPLGNAINYQIRSPFCLSSINSNTMQTADKGRISNVELSVKKLSGDEFDAWKKENDELLTDEFVQAFYSRIFNMIPIIVSNAKELSRAIERKTGDKRLGDQYGALLSGYLSLSSKEILNEESAKLEIEDIDFINEKEKSSGLNDQARLLNKIMQYIVRIPKDTKYEEVTVGEMCERVHEHPITNNESTRALAHLGIKVEKGQIAIANANENLSAVLKSTVWPENWAQTLQRLPFATPSIGGVYFSPACKSRAIWLPCEQVIESVDDKVIPISSHLGL